MQQEVYLPFDFFVAALFKGVKDAVLETSLELNLGAVHTVKISFRFLKTLILYFDKWALKSTAYTY